MAVDFPDKPGGIGFLPDGTPLVVAMRSRQIYRIDCAGRLAEYADLTDRPGRHANDMVVVDDGGAYLGHVTASASGIQAASEWHGELVYLDPERRARVVASGLNGPNGIIVTPDRRTLIVAETWAKRLMAFDVCDDGGLERRRVFADLESNPDGICLDAEGAVWVSYLFAGKFQRVLEGGRVAGEIRPPNEIDGAIACCLGGANRQTLFMAVSEFNVEDTRTLTNYVLDKTSKARGWVYAVEVDVPGAGWP